MSKTTTILTLVILIILIGAGYLFTRNTRAAITVIFPNGGETLEVGKTYNILWDSKNISPSEKVTISYGDGNKAGFIAAGIQNSGSYAWKVSEVKVAGEDESLSQMGPFYIAVSYTRISGEGWEPMTESAGDKSDMPFTIVSSSTSSR